MLLFYSLPSCVLALLPSSSSYGRPNSFISNTCPCRLLDILKSCQKGVPDWDAVDATHSILAIFQTASVTESPLEKVKRYVALLKRRRPQVFTIILQQLYVVGKSTKASADADEILSQISALHRKGSVIDRVTLFLQPPGVVSSKVGQSTIELKPMHDIAFYRPSADSIVLNTMGPDDGVLTISQRWSQENEEDIDHSDSEKRQAMEKLRLSIFSDVSLTSIWYFMDCFAQTPSQARSVHAVVISLNATAFENRLNGRDETLFDSGVMLDCVHFFWESYRFLGSMLKKHLAGIVSSPRRKQKTIIMSLSRMLLFASLPDWIMSFLSNYGLSSTALRGLTSVQHRLLGNSTLYQKSPTLRLLSVCFRPKSKVPKVFCADFYSQVQDILTHLCSDILSLVHSVELRHADHDEAPLSVEVIEACADAGDSFSSGHGFRSSVFPQLFECVLRELPHVVDGFRKDIKNLRKGGVGANVPDHVGNPSNGASPACDGGTNAVRRSSSAGTSPQPSTQASSDDGGENNRSGGVGLPGPSVVPGTLSGVRNFLDTHAVAGSPDCTGENEEDAIRDASDVLCDNCEDLLRCWLLDCHQKDISPKRTLHFLRRHLEIEDAPLHTSENHRSPSYTAVCKRRDHDPFMSPSDVDSRSDSVIESENSTIVTSPFISPKHTCNLRAGSQLTSLVSSPSETFPSSSPSSASSADSVMDEVLSSLRPGKRRGPSRSMSGSFLPLSSDADLPAPPPAKKLNISCAGPGTPHCASPNTADSPTAPHQSTLNDGSDEGSVSSQEFEF